MFPTQFTGASFTWEQVKLEDIADVTKLAGFEFTKYVEYSDTGSIIALRGLNVKNGKLILDDVKYIDNSDFKKLKRSKLYKNDILFTYVGTVGELAIIKENDRFYLAPNVSRIRIKDDTDSKFIIQSMNRKDFYNHIIFPLIATSSQPALSMGNIRKFKLNIPSIIFEQHKIGILLSHIDNNINLHERKCEELTLIKQALLQKLFPKKDEIKPEVRYENFSDAWEQRKLGEVASYRNGKAHEKDINESGKYIVINSKFVSSNGTVRKYSNKMIAPLNKGEISFVLSDVPNGKALARTFLIDQDDTYTLNQRIAGILPKQEVDPYFMSTLMNRNSYFLRFDDGVGQTNLSKRDVTEWNTFYPSYAEQKKIGGFLQQFDSLIALHQRKLEKLKQLKKFLLQNMFI